MKVYKKDEPLDENGFQQVLKGGERAAMEAFIRRLLTMLGAKIRDDQQLAKYAQSLLGQTRPWDRIGAASPGKQ